MHLPPIYTKNKLQSTFISGHLVECSAYYCDKCNKQSLKDNELRLYNMHCFDSIAFLLISVNKRVITGLYIWKSVDNEIMFLVFREEWVVKKGTGIEL